MASIRQEQTSEMIKRHFSSVLQEQGSYIYGAEVLVTITTVQVSPDLGSCKVYCSVYNTKDKQAIILLMQAGSTNLRHALSQRIKKKVRRIPHLDFFLDDTLDEMYRLRNLFDKIKEEEK